MTTLNTPLLAKVAEEAGIGYVKCYDPFRLVAILEAKAAERGWNPYLELHCGRIAYHYTEPEGNGEWTDPQPFDPTDPTDTANAKIRCLAEVFGVEE